VQEQTGQVPQRLASVPELPYALLRARDWFWEIRSRVGGNGFGLSPISFVDLQAWQSYTGRRPTHLEKKAILVFDNVFVRVMGE